jgi:hypothetical protein
MRSFTTTAALAAALLAGSLTLGYAQSADPDRTIDTPNGTIDTDLGPAVVDTSTSTGSIVGDTSSGQPGKSVHQAQDETDAAPPAPDNFKSPCPSGLGTGNGDCR